MKTDGGRLWIKEVLEPSTKEWNKGIIAYNRYEDKVMKPWRDIAFQIDAINIGTRELSKLSFMAVYTEYLKSKVNFLDLNNTTKQSKEEIIEIIKELNWNISACQKAISLKNNENSWVTEGKNHCISVFNVEDHLFCVRFNASNDDKWSMGWDMIGKTLPGGSGLFPRISEKVKDIVQDFMEKWEPEQLSFGGGAVNTSSFYASQCPSWTPEEYSCEIVWRGDCDLQGRDRRVDAIFVRKEPKFLENPDEETGFRM